MERGREGGRERKKRDGEGERGEREEKEHVFIYIKQNCLGC